MLNFLLILLVIQLTRIFWQLEGIHREVRRTRQIQSETQAASRALPQSTGQNP